MRLARVYDDVSDEDGIRVLVDRLWPRGVRKDDPRAGRWRPQLAPSSPLRRWYGHRAEAFEEFAARYRDELAERSEDLDELRAWANQGTLTLVTATRELDRSHLVVLAQVLGEE